MKVHLIYSDVSTSFYPGVHHGLASIIAVLKSHGHDVSLHHVFREPSKGDIMRPILKEAPDLIGFSATTNQIWCVNRWSRWIKEETHIPTICGGIHATLVPDEVLSFPSIDMVCRGEGEYPLLDLVDHWGGDVEHIQNLWLKRGGKVIKNEFRPLIDPLDNLPYANYDLFQIDRIMKDMGGEFTLMASRGCPYSCTYCCNHALRRIQKNKGKYFRVRSVTSLLNEIEHNMAKYPIKRLTFHDDILRLNREWLLEFCDKYADRFDLEFECNLRADTIDDTLLESLKQAGCTQVSFGVESGNEWLREKVLNRKITNEQTIRAFETAHRLGMKTLAYNMIGLPYETPDMVRETIELNKRIAPDRVAVSFFYPYPLTELWNVCKKEGFISNKQATSYVTDSVLNLSTMSRREMTRLYTKFYQYAIRRELTSYPPLIRYPLLAVAYITSTLLGKPGVLLIKKLHLRFIHALAVLRLFMKSWPRCLTRRLTLQELIFASWRAIIASLTRKSSA